jgi:hypothetical protein
MPYGRNMNDCVLLPNGQIIIVNGARVSNAHARRCCGCKMPFRVHRLQHQLNVNTGPSAW